jgi:Trk-type K+ transport system membrane component
VRIFRKLRETIKLSIWDYIDRTQHILRISAILVSVFTMGIIVYFYGFPQTKQSAFVCNLIIHCSLLFYILKYVLSAFFSIHSFQYIRQHKLEAVVILFVIAWFSLTYLFDYGSFLYLKYHWEKGFSDITMLFVQLYFFILMLVEISYFGDILGKIKIGAGGLLISSFLVLISVGTLLLLLPEMTTQGISFIDALFTATSASCLTGLSVSEIGLDFTFKGQFVILLLIQLGGINIVCFASFLSFFYKERTLRYQSVMKEMLNSTLQGSRRLTREIVLYTLVIELIGFAFLFPYLNHTETYSPSVADNVFLAAFHSIASFNNAGLCFLEGGMMNPVFRYSYYSQIITMVLIFLGGIGFLTLHNILMLPKDSRSRWNRLQITSKVVLKMSAVFIVGGALLFFILEYNNAEAGSSVADKICTAFFMSISSRTAGFNTMDIPTLNMSTRLFIIVLMLIGAAPGSMGGGMKLTTFYILIKSAIATIAGKRQVIIYNRSVSYKVVDKAYVVLVFTILIVFVGSFILSISDSQFSMEEIVFEVSSAFGTAGLSCGITTYLSTFGKFIIIVIMYIGRITVLTLALSIARRAFTRYSLAETNFGI